MSNPPRGGQVSKDKIACAACRSSFFKLTRYDPSKFGNLRQRDRSNSNEHNKNMCNRKGYTLVGAQSGQENEIAPPTGAQRQPGIR